jgi:hypothetical protein
MQISECSVNSDPNNDDILNNEINSKKIEPISNNFNQKFIHIPNKYPNSINYQYCVIYYYWYNYLYYYFPVCYQY